MTDEELQAEIQAWEAVVIELTDLPNSISDIDNHLTEEFAGAIEEMRARAGGLVERLVDIPNQLEAKLQGAKQSMEDAMESISEAVTGLEDLFVETIPTAIQESSERIQSAFTAAKEFISEEFMDLSTEQVTEQLEKNAEKIEEGVTRLKERFEQMFNHTREQVEKMLEELANFGSKWTDTVDGINEEYRSMMNSIKNIQRDFLRLADAMDMALATTGAGMSSAAGALSEVKGILEDVV